MTDTVDAGKSERKEKAWQKWAVRIVARGVEFHILVAVGWVGEKGVMVADTPYHGLRHLFGYAMRYFERPSHGYVITGARIGPSAIGLGLPR
jgi:hypothetical protein